MTREQLAAALRKADAAGNTDDARRLAGAIRSLDAVPQPMAQQPNPMVAMGQRAQQEYAQAGSPALPPSATIAPAPSQDPLMPRGGWTPEQQAQQQTRNSDPNDPFNPANANKPAPKAAPVQPQNWNDQIAGWISENLTPMAEKAGASVGGMIGGQRQGAEAVADIGKGVGGGLSEWGATAFRDPVSAANQAIETLDPAHQFAYAYNDANDATKAAATGDWDQVGKELKDLSLSGSFAAMSLLPGNQVYKGIQQATGKVAMAPSIASQVFKAGPTATDRAADILIKKMKADGLTLDDLQKVQRSLANRGDSGVYETFSELAILSDKSSGANLRGLATALGSVPGPAQEAIIARVAANAEALPKRTSRAASRATGQDASKAAATLDELETRLKTESGPLYQRFYDAPVEQQIYDAQIAPVLNAPHGQDAMERAARGLGVEAASLQARNASGDVAASPALQRTYDAAMALKNTLEGKPTGPLPPLALDHVKRAFDDLIDEAGQGTYTGGNLRSAKRNFAESVSRATGGTYGDALGFYEGGKRLEEAFDIGLNALKQPTWQLERAMKAGNRGSPFSAGEIEAIAMGVARHIEDLIEANDQAALTKLLKGKALKNLSTALGDPRAAAKFEQSIQRLAANREWGRRVSGGSDTAMRQAAIDDASRLEEDPVTRTLERAKTATAPPSLFGAAYSAVAKPVAEAAQDAYRRMKYPGIRDEAVNAAIAPMMANAMSRGNLDEIATAIEARLARKNPKLLPPPGGGAAALNGPKGSPVLPPPAASPPARPPAKAGFGGSSKPLDMSEAARMQRAREQGFDVETPWFHAGSVGDELSPTGGELGLHIGNEDAAKFVQSRYVTRKDKPTVATIYTKGNFARAPDLGNFRTPYTYRSARYGGSNEFDPRYKKMWEELDAVASKFGGGEKQGSQAIEKVLDQWRVAVHNAARRNDIVGWEYINNTEAAGEPSRVVFFGDAVRKADAAFDPSQSGSSKLLAGMGASPEGLGAAAGGAAGYVLNPTDANGDGVIDDADRGLNAMGGLISGGLGVKAVRSGANAVRNAMIPQARVMAEAAAPVGSTTIRKPTQAGFLPSGSGKPGAKPPANALAGPISPRVLEDAGRAAKRLPTEVRNKLSANALSENPAPAMQASGFSPDLFSFAQDARTPAPGPVENAFNRLTRQPSANALEMGLRKSIESVAGQRGRSALRVGDESVPDLPFGMRMAMGERNATRKEQSLARRAYTSAEKKNKLDTPKVQRVVAAEREARMAQDILDQARLDAFSTEDVGAIVREQMDAIAKAMNRAPPSTLGLPTKGQQVSDALDNVVFGAPPKGLRSRPKANDATYSISEANDAAKLLFSREYANIWDDIVSGRTPVESIKPGSKQHLVLTVAAVGGLGALGISSAVLADRSGPMKEPEYPKPEDPRVYFKWDEQRRDPRFIENLQLRLNQIDPRYQLREDGQWVEGGNTDKVIKFWQDQNDFTPDGNLTEEQAAMIEAQAIDALRSEPAGARSGLPKRQGSTAQRPAL